MPLSLLFSSRHTVISKFICLSPVLDGHLLRIGLGVIPCGPRARSLPTAGCQAARGMNVWVSTQLNGPSGGEKGWPRGMKSRGRGGRTFPTLEPAAGKAGWPKGMVCLGPRCHKHSLTWTFFTAWLLSSRSGTHRGKGFVPSLLDPPAHLPHCPEDLEVVRQGLPHLPRPEPKTDLCSHSPRTLL